MSSTNGRKPFLDALPPDLVAEVVEGGPAQDGTPRVSAVVSTYNRSHLLGDALAAVYRQDLPPQEYELILVDDGSTDATREVALDAIRRSPCASRYVRLARNAGLSTGRNVALTLARGDVIAHTDDDCVADERWLAEGLAAFDAPGVGAVQGRTGPLPGQRQTFFNHFIEVNEFDGTFSGCNVFYRREAALAVGGFDPSCDYWEDLDFGWRVCRRGWRARFAEGAVVHHQVVPLSPAKWLAWPWHFRTLPVKARHYPEYRRYLFAGLWVHPFHALFTLFVAGALLGGLVRSAFWALSLPYAFAFPFRHGLRGRWPPLKAALHFGWDVITFATLLFASVRNRTLVL